jgi:hypothetical protein
MVRLVGRLRRLVPWLLVAAACDTSYVEGRVQWRSDDARYAIEYVTPPWTSVLDDGRTLRLEVDAELFGTAVAGSPPTHVLSLGPVELESSIRDALPTGIEGFGTTGVDLELPDADDGASTSASDFDLSEVDLGAPGQIARVELDGLVTAEHADLVQELARGEAPEAPWSYEVVISPGVHVRAYYFDDGDRTIRAMFASLFTLTDGDVTTMASTIVVGEPPP